MQSQPMMSGRSSFEQSGLEPSSGMTPVASEQSTMGGLSLSSDGSRHTQGVGALIVNVVEARDLRVRDHNAQPQPYVTLSVVPKSAIQSLTSHKDTDNLTTLGQSVSTACSDCGTNAQWNETFTLAVRNAEADMLHIKVYDHELAKDRLVGESFVPLFGLLQGGEVDQWVQLTGRLNKAAFDGSVHIRLALTMPGAQSTASFGQSAHGCTFVVNVVEARNIARKDLSSPSDPYISLNVISKSIRDQGHHRHFGKKSSAVHGGQEMRTSTCQNTAMPVWNESFQLVATDPITDQLQILCYDQDAGKKDDFIGEALVPLANLGTGTVSDQWVRLNGRVGQFDGAVHLVLTPSRGSGLPYVQGGAQQMQQQQQQQQQHSLSRHGSREDNVQGSDIAVLDGGHTSRQEIGQQQGFVDQRGPMMEDRILDQGQLGGQQQSVIGQQSPIQSRMMDQDQVGQQQSFGRQSPIRDRMVDQDQIGGQQGLMGQQQQGLMGQQDPMQGRTMDQQDQMQQGRTMDQGQTRSSGTLASLTPQQLLGHHHSGHHHSGIGQQQQQQPLVGQQQPMMGQQQPMMGQQQPMMGQQHVSFVGEQPVLGQQQQQPEGADLGGYTLVPKAQQQQQPQGFHTAQ